MMNSSMLHFVSFSETTEFQSAEILIVLLTLSFHLARSVDAEGPISIDSSCIVVQGLHRSISTSLPPSHSEFMCPALSCSLNIPTIPKSPNYSLLPHQSTLPSVIRRNHTNEQLRTDRGICPSSIAVRPSAAPREAHPSWPGPWPGRPPRPGRPWRCAGPWRSPPWNFQRRA